MGASGVKLFDDDLACDVRDLFREFLARGQSCDSASQTIVNHFADVIGTEEESVFWLALAAVEWDYGALRPKLKKKALSIIKEGTDLGRWADDSQLLTQRRKTLDFLARKLKSPNRKPKQYPRKKPFSPQFAWDRGDVFAYQMQSGDFLLLRVVAVERNLLQELPTCELLDWMGREIPEPEVISRLPIRRNKRYPSESSFYFPMQKKHLSRCSFLNLRLPPTMQGDEYRIPLNFSALPTAMEDHFGMVVNRDRQ